VVEALVQEIQLAAQVVQVVAVMQAQMPLEQV
jgi:hypothetical protein